MDFNFARFNHVLIPSTRTGRDRFRRSRLGRALGPLLWLYEISTPEGNAVFAFALATGVLGLDVEGSSLYLLWGLCAGLLVASLALLPLCRLRGGRLEVTAPRRVAVGETVAFALTLRNDSPRGWGCVRLMGPFLPWDGAWVGPSPSLPEVPAGERRTATVQARFSARGEHHLDPFRAGRLVPLGLAVGPSLPSDGCRFVVVPRLARLATLSLADGATVQPGGVPLSSSRGESQELLGVRPYRPGDPVRDLHAPSWARTGVPVVREYRQERFRRVAVILDLGRPDAASGGVPEPRGRYGARLRRGLLGSDRTFEAMVSLAAAVVARLARGEAVVDLLAVGATVRSLTVGRALGTIDGALELLACVESTPLSTAPVLAPAVQPLLGRLSGAVLIAARWDAARAAVGERLRSSGAPVRACVVTSAPSVERPAGVAIVDARAILAGRAVSL